MQKSTPALKKGSPDEAVVTNISYAPCPYKIFFLLMKVSLTNYLICTGTTEGSAMLRQTYWNTFLRRRKFFGTLFVTWKQKPIRRLKK